MTNNESSSPRNRDQAAGNEQLKKIETKHRIMTMRETDWARQVAEYIVDNFPDHEPFTCAAGISPSGTVHFGNLRDVMTSLAIQKQLAHMGKKTKFIFSWDNFDSFRKVPRTIDQSFNQYIGLPLSEVPDPTDETSSYAQYFQQEFEQAMAEMEIPIEYRYQTDEYRSGSYDDLIIQAMQARTEVADILLSHMTAKSIQDRGIDPDTFREQYYPIAVYSRYTGRDNTRVTHYDGESTITYTCLDTEKEDTIDFTKERYVKLPWKLDWAMRWRAEDVVFEPGGHDHASPGGSYDTSSSLARTIFDIEPPVFTEYQFVGLQGLKEKMSGSKGTAVSPQQLLHIYEPDVLKWLYFRKNPHQGFDLAFDTEIYRQYDEFDRAVSDYVEHGAESSHASALQLIDDIAELTPTSYTQPIPFRQAVSFGQILQWDPDKMNTFLEHMGFAYDPASIRTRMTKARAWLEEYNPELKLEVRDTVNTQYVQTMDEHAKDRVRRLRDRLRDVDADATPKEDLEAILYGIPKEEDIDQADLKKEQRRFFKDIYNLLLGQDHGPRLSTFVWAIGKEKVLTLLDI